MEVQSIYSKNFNTLCKDINIVKQTTTPYTLEQNGVTKRKNWTFDENVWHVL